MPHPIPISCFRSFLLTTLMLLCCGFAHAQSGTTNLLVDTFRFTEPTTGQRLIATDAEIARAVSALTAGNATHRARLDGAITQALSDIDRMQANFSSTSPSFSFEARSLLTQAAVLHRIAADVRAATGSPSAATVDQLRAELVQVTLDLVGALQRTGSTTTGFHVGQASNIQALSTLYDWLHPHFSSTERQSIASAMVNYGVIPAFNVMLAPSNHGDRKWYAKPTSMNNWGPINLGAGLFAALALRSADYDGSFSCWPGTSNATSKVTRTFRQHFDAFLPAVLSQFRAGFRGVEDLNGTWDEGPGYNHDFIFPLYCLVASLTPARKNPAAAPATFISDFLSHAQQTSALLVNSGIHHAGPFRAEFVYNDGTWTYSDQPVTYRIAEYARLAAAAQWRGAAWRALDRTPATWNGLGLLWYGLFDWSVPVATGAGMAGFDPATIPQSIHFHVRNITGSDRSGSNEHLVIWRQSWTDSNSAAVSFKGGDKRGDRHDQLDTGDFHFDALGVRWTGDTDRPSNYPSYTQPGGTATTGYHTYPKRAMGQNTLVVNPSRNDYLSRLVAKTWLDVVNPDQAMDDGTSNHLAPVESLSVSPAAGVWTGNVNLTSAYARHGIRSAAQGAPSDPRRFFSFDRTTGALEIRDLLHFSQASNEVFWYLHLPGAGHRAVHLGADRVLMQTLRGSTPVYLLIEHVPATPGLSTNGGFKYSRIDENLPPNQPLDQIWNYSNSATHRSNFRKLTLRLTTTGQTIDSTVRLTPQPQLTGMSDNAALAAMGLLGGTANISSNFPFNNSLNNAHGGTTLSSSGAAPAFQTDAPEGTHSLLLDGVDDGLQTALALSPGENFTLAAWVRVPAGTSGSRPLLTNASGPAAPGFRLHINSEGTSDRMLVLESSNGTERSFARTAPGAIPADTWTHIAAVVQRQSGHVRLFVNGVLAGASSECRTDAPSNGIWFIGCHAPGGASQRFIGGIDDVRLLTRAAPATEVRSFQLTRPDGRWTFHRDLENVSGGGLNATAVNGAALSTANVRSGMQSLALDGGDDHATVPASDLGSLFTLSQWVFITSGRSGAQSLVYWRQPSSSAAAFHLYANGWGTSDRRLVLYTANGASSLQIVSDVGAVPFGEWVHIGAVVNRSSGQATLHVNGAQVASGAIRNDFTTTNQLFIGSAAGSNSTQGAIEELRLDRRLLASSELRALAALRGSAPALGAISVSPSSPAPGASFTAQAGSSDADGDALRTSFSWGNTRSPSEWSATNSATGSYPIPGTFTLNARIDDGTWLTSGFRSVTVSGPNQPPSISADPAAITVAAGLPGPTVTLALGDAESLPSELTCTVHSEDETLIPEGSLVLSGTLGTRQLVVTPVAWKAGTTQVTVTVSDGDRTASVSIPVTVTNSGYPAVSVVPESGATYAWSSPTLWSGETPPWPGPGATVTLLGADAPTAGSSTLVQDLGDPFQLNRLVLDGTGPAAGAAVVETVGSAIEFIANGAQQPVLDLAAGNGTGGTLTHRIGVPVVLSAPLSVQGSGTAAFMIDGNVSGSGGITKSGASSLTLGGTVSTTSPLTLAAGTVVLAPGQANRLPTNMIPVFTGSAKLDLGGNAQSFPSLSFTNATSGLALTATVTNGLLDLSAPGDFTVGATTSSTGPVTGNSVTLDASGLQQFMLTRPGSILIQPLTYNVQSSTSRMILGNSATLISDRLQVGSIAGGTTHSGTLDLGASTLIRADELSIGRSARTTGIVRFRTDLPASPVPLLTLRSETGHGRTASVLISEQWGGSGTSSGTLDLSGGSVDLLAANIEVGRATANTMTASGTFRVGTAGGIVDATTLTLASASGSANGTIHATVMQDGGTVRAGTLTLGSNTGSGAAPSLRSTYTLGGIPGSEPVLAAGLVRVAPGARAATSFSTLQFNAGTLTHADAATDLTLSGLDSTAQGRLGILLGNAGPRRIRAEAGRTISIQDTALLSGTGFEKTGAGALQIAGSHTLTETVTVLEGTLSGSPVLIAALDIAPDGILSPGASGAGVVSSSSGTLAGTLRLPDAGDRWDVSGALQLSGVLDLSGSPRGTRILATYGSLSGTFSSVNGLPHGHEIRYSHTEGASSRNIALVELPDPYAAWIATYTAVPSGLRGEADDPDADGLPNLMEYALGTSPDLAGPGPVVTLPPPGTRLHLTFTRIADPALVYEVHGYSVPGSAGAPIWTGTGGSAEAGPTTVPDAANLPAAGGRFMHLVVRR